jgi:glycosidase/fibronectin type 3 domain-containing protein
MFKRLSLWFLIGLLLGLPSLSAFSADGLGLVHNSRDTLYRVPAGAVPLDTVVYLRLEANADALSGVNVRLYDLKRARQMIAPMVKVNSYVVDGRGVDLWEYAVEVGSRPTVWYYRFIAQRASDGQILYYEDDTRPEGGAYRIDREGGIGATLPTTADLSFQITTYDSAFTTPEWVKNAVIYQIFPDRFRNGDTSNDPTDGSETFYNTVPLYFHETWNVPMVDGTRTRTPNGDGWWNSDFYGGDFAGIIEKLDYLQSLGVTAIYLNPIFAARSNHRYDTSDFSALDPMLGTMADYQRLVDEAKARGMVIVLDGVFNHMSSDSVNFDRYNRFGDVVGACEDVTSPFRAWFVFAPPANAASETPCAGSDAQLAYETWFGVSTLPKLSVADPSVREYFLTGDNSIVQQWGQTGIGGWRLDAAPDVDNGIDARNDYWEVFRQEVRAINPEAYIVGEMWGDASPWLLGDQWDATMNYRLRLGVVGYVRTSNYSDPDNNGDTEINALGPVGLDGVVRALEEDYPAEAYYAMMNVLGSHDTSRLFYVVDNDPAAHRLAALAQYTLPGAPTVYYGDEIALDAPSGLDGEGNFRDDPYNRAPYPWDDTSGDAYQSGDASMLGFYQALGQARAANPALRTGAMVTLLADDTSGLYVFARVDRASGNVAIVALNNGAVDADAQMSIWHQLPTGLAFTPIFDAGALTLDGPNANLTLPARSANIWVMQGGDAETFAALAAPTTFNAMGSDSQVSLLWDAVADAASYVIYRSPVMLGGFEIIGTSDSTSYTDTTAPNGTRYYYAVAAVGATGLLGEMSTIAPAAAHQDISAVIYAADLAGEHTLSYSAPYVLEASVIVGDFTAAQGQLGGIRAEAILVQGDTLADDAIGWVSMQYVGETVEGGDLYSITLRPTRAGAYVVSARFSSDGGLNWFSPQAVTPPSITVLATADETAPASPTNFAAARISASGVTLEWDAVEDAAFYRIFRSNEQGRGGVIAEIPADQATQFTDTNVAIGQKFIYGISAADDAYNLSAPITVDVSIEQQGIPLTLIVTVPENTPAGTIYIAGDFKSASYPLWDPAGIAMEQIDATRWQVTLNLPENAQIEFKFVRGDWQFVEKTVDCVEVDNRRVQVVPAADGTMTVDDLVVTNWRDVDGCP